MSRSRSFAVALGLLAVLVAAAGSGFAGGKLDSPESKLRARIADLHAEMAVLDVECAASRHNLLESLKKLGQLELGDRKKAISELKNQFRQTKTTVPMMSYFNLTGTQTFLEQMQRESQKSGNKEEKEKYDLLAKYLKDGEDGERSLGRLSDLEFKSRLDSARAESDRMKADFLKKCRLLYQKKLELADAEAEYKATK
jgi:hypothetical protein